MLQILRGMLLLSSVVAAVFFARFYAKSRDRFFALFAAAFAMMACNWLGVGLTLAHEESRKWVYVVRLVAFLLMLAGIVEKNRPKKSSAPPGSTS
jgi:hypothetical protein